MDPLFDAQATFGWARPDYALIERADDEGWFDFDIDPEQRYSGDRVDWVGVPGRMMRFEWDQVQATQLNPFDPAKVASFAKMMRDGGVTAEAPDGMLTVVDLEDVKESQRSEDTVGEYGMTRPFTTGDDDLDEYLKDPEEFLMYYAADEDDEMVIRADMTVRAEEAIDKGEGDLGKIVVFLRDGNHRAMAAQIAGESSLWVKVRWHSPDELMYVGLREEDFE